MVPLPPVALVCVAAGAGTRMHADRRKPFLELRGEPILVHTLRRFADIDAVVERLVVVPPGERERIDDAWGAALRTLGMTRLIDGGAERADSVANGIDAVGPNAELILIHDGVRPFVARERIIACLNAAADPRYGGALLARRVTDTIKRGVPAPSDAAGGRRVDQVVETVRRDDLWAAQTPQVLRAELARQALAAWRKDGCPAITDDVALLERLPETERPTIALIEGSAGNIKITTPEDLALAAVLADRLAGASDSQ